MEHHGGGEILSGHTSFSTSTSSEAPTSQFHKQRERTEGNDRDE